MSPAYNKNTDYRPGARWWFDGEEFVTVRGDEVPAAYWKEHKKAWVLAVNYGAGRWDPGEAPSRKWMHGGLEYDASEGRARTRAVMIPARYLEAESNELGEVCP